MIIGTDKKIAVITGATGGIGTQLCKSLVKNGYNVLALCRNSKNGTQNRVAGVEYISGRLDNYNTVSCFVESIINTLSGRKIDILFNNAGVIAPSFKLNDNGIESSLFINCMAPIIITESLKPCFAQSGSRVVNTLSCTIDERIAKRKVRSFDFKTLTYSLYNSTDTMQLLAGFKEMTDAMGLNRENGFVSLINYSITKRLLAFYTSYLFKEYLSGSRNVMALGADPGVVNTGIITQHRWYDPLANIFFRPFIKSPEKGSIPLYRAATESVKEQQAFCRNSAGSADALIIFKGKDKIYLKRL